jgi:hypothetical protein
MVVNDLQLDGVESALASNTTTCSAGGTLNGSAAGRECDLNLDYTIALANRFRGNYGLFCLHRGSGTRQVYAIIRFMMMRLERGNTCLDGT